MKKLALLLSAFLILLTSGISLCSAVSVGHLYELFIREYDPMSEADFIVSVPFTFSGITPDQLIREGIDDLYFECVQNWPEGAWKMSIINAGDLDPEFVSGESVNIVFRNGVGNAANALVLVRQDGSVGRYYPLVNSEVWVHDPEAVFPDARMYLVGMTEVSGCGGGGGCNAGALSPLAGLLVLPLVWLVKK